MKKRTTDPSLATLSSINLTHTRDSCEGYASTHLGGANQYVRDETYIFSVLSARNSPQQMGSAKEARDGLEEYFTRFEDPQGMDMSPMKASELLQSWELALLKYRHVATEPYAEVVALHILVNLAQALLPVTRRQHIRADVGTDEPRDSITLQQLQHCPNTIK